MRSVGYDLSYRVRALEAASATTQRTENPIRRLFVFLDPRAQKGIVLSGARRGGDCSAPLRGPPRRGSSASPPRRFGGSLLRHSLRSARTFLRRALSPDSSSGFLGHLCLWFSRSTI